MIILIPELPSITKTHLYQTFDVTKYVHSGRNALGALLAEGWWSGGATLREITGTSSVTASLYWQSWLSRMRTVGPMLW